jgi:RND family efflux transporter MFP subunit
VIKGWVTWFVAFALVGGLAVLVYARRQSRMLPADVVPAAAAPAPLAVEAAAPPKPSEYLGVVIAEQVVDVAANLDGRLAEVLVRVGDRVAPGAAVAKLDQRDIESDLAVARAELKAARAADKRARIELADADAKLERTTKLGALVPAADLEAARYETKLAANRLEGANAGVAEASARVAKLETLRTDASVRAPFAGLVAARYLDPGARVHAQTPIVRIISADTLRVRFAVPEGEARGLAAGTPILARIATVGVEIGGTVETVAPEVDPAARMIFAEASLGDPAPGGVRPPAGAVARVSLKR